MITATTEMGVRALILLGLRRDTAPVPPRILAESLGCSPTYLGKTLGQLVKAGILQSARGARGGVRLLRDPRQVTVLSIVEACQGVIGGDYCEEVPVDRLGDTCRFHQLMWKLQSSVAKVLTSCTLADLIACPAPANPRARNGRAPCRTALQGIGTPRT